MKNLHSMNLKNKNIVINGGLGLIGSTISKKCLEYGAKILIIDNNKKASINFIKDNSGYSDNFKIIIKNSATKKSIAPIIKETNARKMLNVSIYK